MCGGHMGHGGLTALIEMPTARSTRSVLHATMPCLVVQVELIARLVISRVEVAHPHCLMAAARMPGNDLMTRAERRPAQLTSDQRDCRDAVPMCWPTILVR